VLPYLGLGNIALHGGKLEEAEKWFLQARQLQAEHPAVLFAWGRLLSAKSQRLTDEEEVKKQLQEARSLLEKSKSKGERSATLHAELGTVYYRLAMWEKAVEAYTDALRMSRRRTDLRFYLGQAYAQLGQIAAAEQKYREILALSPDDARAFKALQELGKKY
jgi:tetratricopeptide (TPR) repeat protein